MILAKQNMAPRILVVRLSAIGDCLHAVPVVEEIRRQFPKAHIGWLVQPAGHSLIKDHSAVDRFHLFHRGNKGLRAARSLLDLRSELRSEEYEIAIDLQGLTKSGLLARLSGARHVCGFGAPESREFNAWFVSQRFPVGPEVKHVVDRNLALLGKLGMDVPERAAWHMPEVDLAGSEVGALLDMLPVGSGPAVINPGTTWPTKIWAQERFAEVASGLVAEGLAVVVTWAGSQEESMADAIVGRARQLAEASATSATSARSETSETESSEKLIIKAPPTSLTELSGLFQRSKVVVANDSGPLHMAVAVGVPAVGVYGPTDPARNGPYGATDEAAPAAAVTLANERQREFDGQKIGGGELLNCQYCWKTSCHRGDTACLSQLTADPVLRTALRLINRLPSPP